MTVTWPMYTFLINNSIVSYRGTTLVLTSLSVQCLCKLVDCWGNLQTLVKNGLLSLQPDISWPSNKPSKIPFRLNVSTYILIILDVINIINKFTWFYSYCKDNIDKTQLIVETSKTLVCFRESQQCQKLVNEKH